MSERQSGAHVTVIEDDDLERGALGRLRQAGGFEPIWLVVDVNLTGISGIDLQRQLRDEGSR